MFFGLLRRFTDRSFIFQENLYGRISYSNAMQWKPKQMICRVYQVILITENGQVNRPRP